MEVKVTIEDYFSKEELRDIVEDEVRCYAVNMVRDYFKHNSYRDFVEGVARDAYWDAVEQLGEDTLGKVRRQVRKTARCVARCGSSYRNSRFSVS